jgi:hypothetical protein
MRSYFSRPCRLHGGSGTALLTTGLDPVLVIRGSNVFHAISAPETNYVVTVFLSVCLQLARQVTVTCSN